MSLFDRDFSEKRNFIRMKVNTPLTIQHAGKSYDGSCQDLSADGMSVDTEASFQLGDQLEVLIEQQGSFHQGFQAIAEVARIQDNGNGNYNLGLTIKQILD